jgi:hypothetical protein
MGPKPLAIFPMSVLLRSNMHTIFPLPASRTSKILRRLSYDFSLFKLRVEGCMAAEIRVEQAHGFETRSAKQHICPACEETFTLSFFSLLLLPFKDVPQLQMTFPCSKFRRISRMAVRKFTVFELKSESWNPCVRYLRGSFYTVFLLLVSNNFKTTLTISMSPSSITQSSESA